jgi:hypothetical protein
MRDIHVIHRPARQLFASATRVNASWSRGDRGGCPSLWSGGPFGGTGEGGRGGRTDLRRPAMSGAFGQTTGSAGKRRRKRYRSLARCGSKAFPRGGGGQSRTRSGCPKKGRRRGAATGFRGANPESWPAVPKKRKPELVRQDRKRDPRASARKIQGYEHRQILRSAQGGLAAMPGPYPLGVLRLAIRNACFGSKADIGLPGNDALGGLSKRS